MLFVVLVSTSFTMAQQTVRFSGKVVNSRNEAIPNASVIVEGSNKKMAANAEGSFFFNLEAGKKYTIRITSAGYNAKVLEDVFVALNDDNNITVVLETKGELGEVVVRSSVRRESTSALLNLQRNNTAVSSVLAADFIRRTPDKNTGEVLRRVSGASIQDNKYVIVRGLSDRYNSAFINGAQLPSSEPDKKAFSFDVIPSNLIDNIVINKTATPDMTGEFAGGLVQIQTKDIPTKNQLIFGAAFGFNTQSAFKDFVSNERGSTDWLGFTDSRKLPGSYPKKYGEFNKLSEEDRIEVARSFDDQAYQEVQSNAGVIQQYNLTWANATKSKDGSTFGSVLGLTYRNSKLLFDAEKQLFEKGDNGQQFFDFNDQQNKYSTTWGALPISHGRRKDIRSPLKTCLISYLRITIIEELVSIQKTCRMSRFALAY